MTQKVFLVISFLTTSKNLDKGPVPDKSYQRALYREYDPGMVGKFNMA